MNREHRRSRWLIAALTALLWGSLGLSCEDLIAQPEDSGPPATLRVAEDHLTLPYLDGFFFVVDLIVATDRPFQAWNLAVSSDSEAISWIMAGPHPDFDDDGKLFGETRVEARSISNIVDLRHGSGAPSGSVRVAQVLFHSDTNEPVKIRILGKVTAPDGTPFSVVVSEFATIAP